MMFGAFFWGGLSDRVGRKQCLLISMSVNGFFAFLSSFVQGYSMFLLCRMVSGFGWVHSSLLLNIFLLYTLSSSMCSSEQSPSEGFSLSSLICLPTGSSTASPPPKSKHRTEGYSNCLAPAHPPPLSGRREGTKQNKKVCRNEPSTVNEHLCVLMLVLIAWLPTSFINEAPSHLSDLICLFIYNLYRSPLCQTSSYWANQFTVNHMKHE